MNHKKFIITALLCMLSMQVQAFNIKDTFNNVCAFMGIANATEIIDGKKHHVIYSYQAHKIISKIKDFSTETLTYKYLQTNNTTIATKHIIDGTIFVADGMYYIVRSSLHNSTKIYQTQKTIFGYEQIIIDPTEALAIMNDTRFLTFTHFEVTSTVPTRVGKYSGYVAPGSYFTSNGINYIVQ
ncbi:hypothetical protein [Candidatus Chromulinivorax destructor]|uniref:Uncharacterized protein n=1 Tax=Candidatus Chromulinivorax destructor TaxID=2066483 RepID=A0A345ZA28_9BACT|nr:hypothetical protein [Candidatus Chromulinivorax destructor]AXK60145.1 hypothetical protein C0J27_00065 [Candidatus Chromulinivorax destructor]